MWAINNKTGLKHEMTDETWNRFYKNNPDMEKLAEKIEPKQIVEKKTLKDLKKEAKDSGIKGSDRMSRDKLETLLSE